MSKKYLVTLSDAQRDALRAQRQGPLTLRQRNRIDVLLHTAQGDTDAAIAALPHLLEEVNGLTKGNLRVDPAWDPLRKDPRFQKLCEEPNK